MYVGPLHRAEKETESIESLATAAEGGQLDGLAKPVDEDNSTASAIDNSTASAVDNSTASSFAKEEADDAPDTNAQDVAGDGDYSWYRTKEGAASETPAGLSGIHKVGDTVF